MQAATNPAKISTSTRVVMRVMMPFSRLKLWLKIFQDCSADFSAWLEKRRA
jgi:hypothetical protein